MLKYIVTSVSRQKILKYFFEGGVGFSPYVRQVVRDIELEINAVRRELLNLQSEKIILSEPRGNRIHYTLNIRHPLYYDLASIIAKQSGLGGLIYRKKKKLGNIKFAILSLSYFLNNTSKNSIDLLLVGDMYLGKIKSLIEKYESDHSKEVNYMILSSQEFEILRDRRDPILTTCLIAPRCVLIGNAEKFLI